jgi:glycosyltransferase involved in cell wall biosynthesis
MNGSVSESERVPHEPTLVMIPAWDEAETVGDVVREVRAAVPYADVVVIDDASTDGTGEAARAAGAVVLSHPFNLGLGAGLQTGYRYAWRKGYRRVAHLDGDGQHPARFLPALFEALDEGADLVLGSRFVDPNVPLLSSSEAKYRACFSRRLGIRFFRSLLSLATRRRFTDSTTGYRAAGPRVIPLFAQRYASDYPELESLVRVVKAGLVVEEVPVMVRPRVVGASKITPLRSVYWVLNGVVSLGVACLRPGAAGDHVDRA